MAIVEGKPLSTGERAPLPGRRVKLSIVIPCYNEADGIAAVIKSFPMEKLKKSGYQLQIIVVDNNSDDGTAEVARKNGATVLHEPQQGKGNAMRLGFRKVHRRGFRVQGWTTSSSLTVV